MSFYRVPGSPRCLFTGYRPATTTRNTATQFLSEVTPSKPAAAVKHPDPPRASIAMDGGGRHNLLYTGR